MAYMIECKECNHPIDISESNVGDNIICNECGCEFVLDQDTINADNKKKTTKTSDSANPRCPNIECDFHKDPPDAKSGFVINVIEEGAMGKIFKSEAYGIVSCKNCGHIIGVGNKG